MQKTLHSFRRRPLASSNLSPFASLLKHLRAVKFYRPQTTILPILAVLCVSAGCAPKKAPTPKDTAKTRRTPTEQRPLSAILIGAERPNSYTIRIAVHLEDGRPWLIKKIDIQNKTTHLIPVTAEMIESGLIDSNIQSDHSYTYGLVANEEESSPLFFPQVIEVPRDLTANELNEFLSQSKKETEVIQSNGRFFLSHEHPITTFGRSLMLNFREIHSQDGLIQAFAKVSSTNANQPGRNAGTITIKTKKLVGSVRFNLQGETGARGQDGNSGTPGVKGDPGPSFDPSRSIFCQPAQSGHNFYKLHPGRGGDGGPGGKGSDGSPGLPGGDGGNLFLEITDFESGQISEVNLEPGIGGDGGSGGIGGPGGDGGPGGPIHYTGIVMPDSRCSPAPSGSIGAQGSKGAAGPKGKDGHRGHAQLNGKLILL